MTRARAVANRRGSPLSAGIAAAPTALIPSINVKVKVVTFRWAVEKQLRGAVIDFAGDSHHANPWAANLYQRARARHLEHPHATRVLARAWLHIIWRCWQDRVPYDPTKHRALQRLNNQNA